MRRLSVFGLLALFEVAIGAAGSAAAGEVVVLMSAPVDAYEEALQGFEESLQGHRVVKTHQMGGKIERGREILAKIQSGEKPDLIFASGVFLEVDLPNKDTPLTAEPTGRTP